MHTAKNIGKMFLDTILRRNPRIYIYNLIIIILCYQLSFTLGVIISCVPCIFIVARHIATKNQLTGSTPNYYASYLSAIMFIISILCFFILSQWVNIIYIMMLFIILSALTYYLVMQDSCCALRSLDKYIVTPLLYSMSSIPILLSLLIICFLLNESFQFFSLVSFVDFITGNNWQLQYMHKNIYDPTIKPFGMLHVLTGTIMIVGIAMILSFPISLIIAIGLSEFYKTSTRKMLKFCIEVLSGIPTVVYGYFAATFIGPFLKDLLQNIGIPTHIESALVAGIVMSIMITPYMITLMEDAIGSVPIRLKEASLAMGATELEKILHVVIPVSTPGIIGALLLSISRCIGETMIVVMAAGLIAYPTLNPLDSVTTITVQIVLLLTGEQEYNDIRTMAAYGLSFVLLILTLSINLVAFYIANKKNINQRITKYTITKHWIARSTKSKLFQLTHYLVLIKTAIIFMLLLYIIFCSGYKAFVQTQIIFQPDDLILHKHDLSITDCDEVIRNNQLSNIVSDFAKMELYEHYKNHHLSKPYALTMSSKFDLHYKYGHVGDSEIIDNIKQKYTIRYRLNTFFLTGGDSRYPEIAGIFNAFIGTILTVGICMMLAIPISVCAAICLQYLMPRNILTKIIEISIQNLAAIPSIIFGVLVVSIILPLNIIPRSSALIGGITLSLIILPNIIVKSKQALSDVPLYLQEAALSLGATKLQSIFHYQVPTAASGIITGIMTSVARAIGETAPLMLVGMMAFTTNQAHNIFDATTVIPMQVYLWFNNPEQGFIEKTSGSVIILLLLLAVIHILLLKYRKQYKLL